jgi:DNA polymerase-4
MTSPPARLRRIAHLDMDAFYASIELLRYRSAIPTQI